MLENVISVYVWKDRVRITNLYHTREFIYQFTQAELPFCRWRLDGYCKFMNVIRQIAVLAGHCLLNIFSVILFTFSI